MKCGLAALGFINNDVKYNEKVITETMIKFRDKADIFIFGEAFLQGFYAATFDVEHDEKLALNKNDAVITRIRSVAKKYGVAVSFGFIEKSDMNFYSSQITIDNNGNIINLYRRVSEGWKEPFATKEYLEGHGFYTFTYMNRKIAVALCGDLWFDKNVEEIKKLRPDVVFWPVYTDYNYEKWNTTIKYEYAEQANKIGCKVLYVNSFCKDKNESEIAKGGAALFLGNDIPSEIPAGKEEILFIDV